MIVPDNWRERCVRILKEIVGLAIIVAVFYILPTPWRESVETLAIVIVATSLAFFAFLGTVLAYHLYFVER